MRLDGRVAVLTGAASGIGRALAVELAGRGCRLALVDRDEAGLGATVELLPAGAPVSSHLADLADRARIETLVPEVLDRHGGADLLVNNAGVALGGTFEQTSEPDFEWLFEVNFWAPVRLCRRFLPALRRSPEARIVNVSSLFGLIAPAGQTAYAASKFALRGFSEALRHELAPSRIGVTVIHPGGVATGIARHARAAPGATEAEIADGVAAMERLLRLPPERAATAIAEAIVSRRPRLVLGRDARLAAALERLLPVGHLAVLDRLRPRARARGAVRS